MTVIQAAILGAIVTSPFSVSLFEYAKDRFQAKYKYHGWQGVFLSDNSAYFGKISSTSKLELKITEVYYIRIEEQEQFSHRFAPIIPDNISLAKLGNEIHGPKDYMTINRRHIVFIEDLKEDSQVVTAIKEFNNTTNVTKK